MDDAQANINLTQSKKILAYITEVNWKKACTHRCEIKSCTNMSFRCFHIGIPEMEWKIENAKIIQKIL